MKKNLLTILVVLVNLCFTYAVKAADVIITSAQSFASLDASDGLTDGIFNVTGNLTIANGGSINCNDISGSGQAACPINIVVSGNMEIQAGGAIYAENRIADGNGGNISITVGGSFIMKDAATPLAGALISSSNLSATSGNMSAGNITILVTGFLSTEKAALIKANAFKGRAGSITLSGSGNIDLDGTVISQSGGSGTGPNQGHGGTIFLKAVNSLRINDNGVVSSNGGAPGADLVQLKGCSVTVWGRVESTGSGHAIPNNPGNYISINRTDKPANSTAAVEVWATNSLIIDNLNHNGEINADLCCGGGTSGTSWIDLFSKKNITIIGSSLPSKAFAVHANGLSGINDDGGTVTIKSLEGSVTASGKASQSNGAEKGGRTTIEAKGDVDMSDAINESKGSSTSASHGGRIDLRSWGTAPLTGNILSSSGSLLNVSGGTPKDGIINLTACGTIDFPTGTWQPDPPVVPTRTTGVCGGAPLVSSYVLFLECPSDPGPCVSTVNCSGAPIIVDEDVTIDFNQADPNNYYSGDADLKPYFTYDVSGATPDKWKAIFSLTNHKLFVKTGATITVTAVGGGNNKYAPGISINSNCDVEVEEGGHVVVESLNRQAGDILVDVDGNVIINGEVRNEVTGSNGRSGALSIKSKFGSIVIGLTGQVYDLGGSAGTKPITLSTCGTCEQADIVVNGLVKAYTPYNNLDDSRPAIRVVALNGAITINANTAEPLYDEFSSGGTRYDIYGGLLSWVGSNDKPGNIKVQARYDVTVNGHGDDPTAPVRQSFGGIAAIATASGAPGGLVDVRSLEGNIIADNRAFDVSGRNRLAVNYAHINLAAKLNISLSRTGPDNSFNPVVDASSPTVGDNGGLNTLRSYSGGIIIGTNALVSAAVPAHNSSTQGVNLLTSCSGVTNNGTVDPADLNTSDDAGVCSPSVVPPLFITCDLLDAEGGPLPILLNSFYAKRNNAVVNLNWETATEINAKEFVLQRNINGTWETIVIVPAKNMANGASYSYADNNQRKTVTEYRIKMVDFDNRSSLSEIRAVKGISTASDFTVYPNPSSGNAKVTITDISESTDVQLIDNAGRVLKIIPMKNVNTIDLPNLQKGIYMIRVINSITGESQTKKLTVIF